jgi:RHS repeat-associated protein
MEYDGGTNLYHTWARYYSPRLQRFLSEDPLGFGGGDVNLFAYVGNSPENFTDPVGLLGFGFTYGIQAEGGWGGPNALAVSASWSVGYFTGGGRLGSVATFFTRGALIGSQGTSFVYGGFVGSGVSIFFTWASDPPQITGPFNTSTRSAGLGRKVGSLQTSSGSDSAGQPVTVYSGGLPTSRWTPGFGLGVSHSSYTTTTSIDHQFDIQRVISGAGLVGTSLASPGPAGSGDSTDASGLSAQNASARAGYPGFPTGNDLTAIMSAGGMPGGW